MKIICKKHNIENCKECQQLAFNDAMQDLKDRKILFDTAIKGLGGA